MKKLYCNGKKGFCDRSTDGVEGKCMDILGRSICEYLDGTGSKSIDICTHYDEIKNMNAHEMALFIRQISKNHLGNTVIDGKTIGLRTDVLDWLESAAEPDKDVIMTVAEIEKKLGIKNLKIVKE